MKDRIVGILPSLMQKPVRSVSPVLDEPVSIAVSIAPHPEQRGLDLRPDLLDERKVAATLIVGLCQDNEQGGGIHAPVVPGKWHLSQSRHLAVACFVKNLAGFRILFGDRLRS